jgi:glyoxylase-like metal-dependent hydrolase (beta-lactamase superfamily II)
MEPFTCRTCAVQHAAAEGGGPPERCGICEDERQYVGWSGQQWAALAELRREGFRTEIREHEDGLTGIGVEPRLGIGQRALLVRTSGGNVLWDCIGLIDDAAVERVRQLGGIAGVAMSHPHFYGCVVEWSRAFGGAPIHLPRADLGWLMRPDDAVVPWEGSVEIVPGVTAVECGGHFEGSAVLHWPGGAGGRGALLTGDSITVVQDRRFVSFMRSYPNLIPLPRTEIERVVAAVRPLAFDRIYGGWWGSVVASGAKEAVERSAERYLRWTESSSQSAAR